MQRPPRISGMQISNMASLIPPPLGEGGSSRSEEPGGERNRPHPTAGYRAVADASHRRRRWTAAYGRLRILPASRGGIRTSAARERAVAVLERAERFGGRDRG